MRIPNVARAALFLLFIPITGFAEIDFKGFASVGAGIFSEDDFEFNRVDDELSTDPFVKFGLQAKAEVNEKTDFTAQFIARGVDGFEVEAEWAYVTYHASSSTDIRVGRIRSPFFFYSDYLDVSYAHPWIRPPTEVYRLPFSTVNGVDIYNSHDLGDWTGSVQFYYGRLVDEVYYNGFNLDLNLENFTGINYTLANDWLTLRASWNQGDATVETPEPALPVLALAPQLAALAVEDEKTSFYSLGFNIDYANWLAGGEFTVLDMGEEQNVISDDEAWYLMVGRRFGNISLYYTYVQQEADPDFSSFPTPQLLGAAQAVVSNYEDTNHILGFRYDYGAAAAFKVEVTDVEYKLSPNPDGTLVAFSIDVIF